MKQLFKTICISIAFLHSVVLLDAQEFLSAVPTTVSLLDAAQGDFYVPPSGATASDYVPGNEIERSFDRDMNTLYSSSGLPVILDYTFDHTVSQIDRLVYHPPKGTSVAGQIGSVEIWYAADGGPMTKYGDFNFGYSDMSYTVDFEPAVMHPETIRIIVTTGRGNSAACAEMEFFRSNSAAFNPQSVFTDATCSELKAGVTVNDINAIGDEFYRRLASEMYHGTYDSEFRVQEYKAYQNPSVMAQINKTRMYGRRDNPTGIYVGDNFELVLFVGNTDAQAPSLFVHDNATVAGGSTYNLRQGLNRITVSKGGLIYIMYYTSTGTEPPVKINFVNGTVNGYYDKARHTPADWPRLLAKASYSLYDMKGDYAFMNFETSAFRTFAATDGPELLDMYDELVYKQMDFQGMVKHNKMFNTRLHFQVDPNPDVYMYATNYYTGYHRGTQADILSIARLTDKNNTTGATSWGPAHEVGHVNQTGIGLCWVGTTEVTNNILSQYITIGWGVQSRLQAEDMGGGQNRYTKAINGIVKDASLTSYLQHDDVFCRLVPFWQLKLYMHDVLGMTDFYGDVYEKVRVNPDPGARDGCSNYAMCQLEFVYLVCEVSGYDMTEFFTDWKFLSPATFNVNDYSSHSYIFTKQGIDAVKARIAAIPGIRKPPVPEGKKLYEIDDGNWGEFVVE